MECPRCGYERQPEDTHCQLCNVDFGLLERQANEKKLLKERQKKQGNNGVLKLESDPGISELETVSTEKAVGECPKCGFGRRENDVECSNCGIVFEKHEQLLAKQKEAEDAKKQEEQRRFEEERARIQREAEKGIAEAKAKRENEAKKKAQDEKEASTPASPVATSKVAAKRKPAAYSPKKIGIGVVALLGILLVGWGGTSVVKYWLAQAEQKRLIAQQQEEKRRIEQEQQRIAADFRARRGEITARLKALIDSRKYDEFKQEIVQYEIPPLSGELDSIKDYLAEIKLYDSAKWISAKEYRKNYEIYHKLLQMDPKNKTYAKKTKYYRKKYAEKNYQIAKQFIEKKKKYRKDLEAAMAAINKAIELEGNKKRYGKIRYRIKTAQLLFYEGNDKIQMAVRNDGLTKGATGGQRKLFVWLKNVGTSSVFINVDYFTLVGRNNKRYSYNNCSRELIVNLQPGQETKGIILFYTSVRPKELIFAHINAGTISRRFP